MEDERDGILRLGEVPIVRRRERILEENHEQALRSGREQAWGAVLAYVLERERRVPMYEDTRPWTEMATFLRDRIKENADGATS